MYLHEGSDEVKTEVDDQLVHLVVMAQSSHKDPGQETTKPVHGQNEGDLLVVQTPLKARHTRM